MQKTDNPCGLDGFAFLEFSGPDMRALEQQFQTMGFMKVAHHNQQNIALYQQGEIQFIVNGSQDSQAEAHAKTHGAGACAMGFKVHDAQAALAYALQNGAEEFKDCDHAHHGLPAIQAIGGSIIYFVDDKHKPFAQNWKD